MRACKRVYGDFSTRSQTRQGIELKNKSFHTFLKQHHVHHFVTYNETKAQVVERFNRTLKQIMWRLLPQAARINTFYKKNDRVNGNSNQTFIIFYFILFSDFHLETKKKGSK